jgi:hypothetical protein
MFLEAGAGQAPRQAVFVRPEGLVELLCVFYARSGRRCENSTPTFYKNVAAKLRFSSLCASFL